MKRIITFLLLAILANVFIYSAIAQPGIEWQKSLGGEEAVSINLTKSGGYIVAGNSWGYSFDSSLCGKLDSNAAWAAKLDRNGSTIWKRCFATKRQDGATSIIQTKDGSFIFCGWTNGVTSEGAIYHGNYDAWVVKLDSLGTIQWQYTYGGSNYDYANSIIQTYDGGYAFAGWTWSTDGDVTGNHGADDEWVVKLNSIGKIEWQKCLGGSNYDYASSIIQTPDSGLVITGTTSSNDGNAKGNHGYKDMWIVKLKADTSIAWQRCAGGAGDDQGTAVCRTNDGSYLSVGISQSYFLNDNYHGGDDFYCVKLNDSGKILSQSCYGGSQDDQALAAAPTNDGGYIIVGQTTSSDGDVGRLRAIYSDIWVVKCDFLGNLEWQKPVGGKSDELAFSVIQSSDGGYVFTGETASSDGDVTTNYHGAGAWISWIVRLSDNASVSAPKSIDNSDLKILPDPSSSELNIFYTTTSAVHAQLSVYDLLGNCLASMDDNNTSIGRRQMKFDASKFPQGMYILRLQSGILNTTGKFTIVR